MRDNKKKDVSWTNNIYNHIRPQTHTHTHTLPHVTWLTDVELGPIVYQLWSRLAHPPVSRTPQTGAAPNTESQMRKGLEMTRRERERERETWGSPVPLSSTYACLPVRRCHCHLVR
ncbi:hypothetical protein CTA2_2050 [Colletotrichum tanaceti]|nr:hypothetical protein CTA2_2050 [Colletotrichum tanaceti]